MNYSLSTTADPKLTHLLRSLSWHHCLHTEANEEHSHISVLEGMPSSSKGLLTCRLGISNHSTCFAKGMCLNYHCQCSKGNTDVLLVSQLFPYLSLHCQSMIMSCPDHQSYQKLPHTSYLWSLLHTQQYYWYQCVCSSLILPGWLQSINRTLQWIQIKNITGRGICMSHLLITAQRLGSFAGHLLLV